MGIRFVYGRAGSGKSTFCINKIKEKITEDKADNKLIYIVPEQYTFQRETMLLKKVSERGLLRAQVLSFKKMAHMVFEECGGRSKTIMKHSGAVMLIYKVIHSVYNDLQYFNRIADKNGFDQIILETISEFKKYNISAEELNEAKENVDDESLKKKLSDLTLIYDTYNKTINENTIDSDDELTLLAKKLKCCDLFNDSEIWIDEFTTFTPQQIEIIRILADKSREINITLCLDSIAYNNIDEFTDLFNPIKRTESLILKIMKEDNIKYLEPVDLNNNQNGRFKSNEELSHLEKYFYTYPYKPYKKDIKNIKIYKANNTYDEVENVSKEIIKLVRDKGYRYKDISVVCRNVDDYQKIVSVIFNDYGIPYFLDMKIDILSNPLVVLVLSSIEIYLKGWSYESVFKYLKSGLTKINVEDIDNVENYVLEKGIKGSKWTSELSYYGDNIEYGDYLIETMKCFREPLMKFHKSFNKNSTVKEICTALYDFLIKLDVFNQIDELIKYFEENGLEDKVKEYSQISSIVLDILDQAVQTLGDNKLSIKEFYNILNSGFESQELGVIPVALDQVNIGDVARIKGRDVKALFIVGVNDGILPSSSRDEGILSDLDRETLADLKIKMSSTTKIKVFEEQFIVYSALTLASDYMMISYPMADFEGKALRASIIIPRIKKIFRNLKEDSSINEPEDELYKITAPNPTFNELILALRRNYDNEEVEEYWSSVYSWFKEKEEFKNKAGYIFKATDYSNSCEDISRQILKDLYGNDKGRLTLSVSRLEKYQNCPFSYFVQYGLKAKDRKIYEFTAPDIGSFMHDIIDSFTKKVKNDKLVWGDLTSKECGIIVSDLVEKKLSNESESILNSSKRYKYFTDRFKRIITRSVSVISEQMRKGEFEIFKSEFVFGDSESSNQIKLDLPSGEEVFLTGKIDRIDKLDIDGKTYIRIIDYKTGKKEFSLNELYYGLQIQLLVYLDAILKNSEEILKKQSMPGAILYFRVDDPIINTNKQLSEEDTKKLILEKLKMDGLVIKDVDVIKKMDKDIAEFSVIIPAKLKKDGDFTAQSSVITEEQFNILRDYVNVKMVEICEDMFSGKIRIEPCKTNTTAYCSYCDYAAICQFDTSIKDNKYKIVVNNNDNDAWDMILRNMKGVKANGED